MFKKVDVNGRTEVGKDTNFITCDFLFQGTIIVEYHERRLVEVYFRLSHADDVIPALLSLTSSDPQWKNLVLRYAHCSIAVKFDISSW